MPNYLKVIHDIAHLAEGEGARVLAELESGAPAAVADLVRVLLTEVPQPEPPATTTEQPAPVDVAAALAALTPAQRAEILAQLTQTPAQ